MEEYFRLQSDNSMQELNLRNRLLTVKEQLQQYLTIKIDMEEFINLIFFCDFDFEKYLQE